MAQTWCLVVLLLGGVAAADPAKKAEPPAAPTIWCGTWLDLGGPVTGIRIERMQDAPPPPPETPVVAIDDVTRGALKLQTTLDAEALSPRRRCLLCR